MLGLLVGPYECLVDGHDALIATPQTAVALLQLDLEMGSELAPLREDERRDEVDTAPHGQLTDIAQHVGDGMLAHLLSRAGGDGLPDTRPEEAHILVDLGRGRDGGAGIAADDALLDGDGGRQPTDPVGLGLGHAADELAGVAREALHIAALPLGIERVEGQRTLARAADPGDDDELAAGDLEVYVLEVIDTYVVKEDAGARILAVAAQGSLLAAGGSLCHWGRLSCCAREDSSNLAHGAKIRKVPHCTFPRLTLEPHPAPQLSRQGRSHRPHPRGCTRSKGSHARRPPAPAPMRDIPQLTNGYPPRPRPTSLRGLTDISHETSPASRSPPRARATDLLP